MPNNGEIRGFTKNPKTATFTRLLEVVTHSGHSLERVCPIHVTEHVSDTRNARMPYALGRGTALLSKFSPLSPAMLGCPANVERSDSGRLHLSVPQSIRITFTKQCNFPALSMVAFNRSATVPHKRLYHCLLRSGCSFAIVIWYRQSWCDVCITQRRYSTLVLQSYFINVCWRALTAR